MAVVVCSSASGLGGDLLPNQTQLFRQARSVNPRQWLKQTQTVTELPVPLGISEL